MIVKTLIDESIYNLQRIQGKILEYLEDSDEDENAENELIKYLDQKDFNICNNKNNLMEFLLLISKISKNHNRSPDSTSFISKIERIISKYQNEILKYFTNMEIFNIFKGNKRILLSLFEKQILNPDDSIRSIITNNKYAKRCYPHYFKIEFNIKFFNDDEKDEEQFKQKRKIGENDSYLCQVIRNDAVEDFISYINRSNISVNTKINESIYETNSFLIDKKPTLIEYASFFGSIQIFQYLMMNNAELSPTLWPYIIHGNNQEIFHYMEENHYMNIKTIRKCYKESIKCHHNDIMNYIRDNLYIQNDHKILKKALRYHNYSFINIDDQNYDEYDRNTYHLITKQINHFNFDYSINDFSFTYKIDIKFLFGLVEYDYNFLIDLLIKNELIDFKTTKDFDIHDGKKGYMFGNIFNFAVRKRKIEIVDMFLKCDKNINFIANEYYHDRINSNIDIKTEKNSLVIALDDENIDMLLLLLSSPKINIYQKLITNIKNENTLIEKSFIHFAIEKGNQDIMKIILQQPIFDFNTILYEKEIDKNIEHSILSKAIALENIEMVQLFLSQPNIDVNKKITEIIQNQNSKQIKRDKTILQFAMEKGNIDILKLLISHKKININAKSIEYYERNEKCEYMKKGKHATKTNKSNKKIIKERTALHYAVETGNIELISLLIKHNGIDLYKQDEQFKTPVEYTQNDQIIEIFKNAIGKN